MLKLRLSGILLVFTLALALVPVTTVMGATIEVEVGTDPSPPVTDGDCTLREAIENANDNFATWPDCAAGTTGQDTITFKSGVNKVTWSNSVQTGEIFVDEDLKISQPVTFDGAGLTRLFRIAGGAKLTLENTTLQNGFTNGAGGVILIDNGSLVLLNCNVKNNKAEGTGGALHAGGTINNVDITNCNFENNSAGTDGGAISKITNGAMNITTSKFVDNKAEKSGGAIVTSGMGTITATAFKGNKAKGAQTTEGGGAIFFSNGAQFNIVASAFAGNQVTGNEGRGGAIFNAFGSTLAIEYSHFGTTPIPLPPPFDSLTSANETTGSNGIGGAIYNRDVMAIVGSSFIGNKSAKDGGAIANDAQTDDDAFAANSTFHNNTATGKGGAIYLFGTNREISLYNSTVSRNTGGNGGGIYNDSSSGGVRLLNTIIFNNDTVNCAGSNVANVSTNLLTGTACPADTAILQGDADLKSLELTFSLPAIVTYVRPLGSDSAANGAGNNAVCSAAPVLNLDQRGMPRPQGGSKCDIGAYESSGAPEIEVLRPGNVDVPDGGSVNFGTTTIGNPITITFTVENSGNALLVLGSPGAAPAGFSVTGFGQNPIPADSSTTFSVTCNASTINTFSGMISFSTNDSNENPFNFNVSCEVQAAPPPTETPSGPTETPTETNTPGGPTETPTETPVITGIEQLVNGSFELKDGANKPLLDPWKQTKATKDKIKCNKPEKVIAHVGMCAYMYKGSVGENSKITQTVNGAYASGHVFTLSLYANASKATTSGKVKLRVKYADGSDTGKINLTLGQTSGYTLFADSYTLISPNVSKVKVQVQNKSKSGKLFVDGISLKYAPSALLPLP